MAGDFNMVERADQKNGGVEGANFLKGQEKQAWEQARARGGFYLLDQDVETYYHKGMHHSSVIDRAYTNLH
eukprot:1695075-Lingulodinium_polyedra.AAC.1